MLTRGQSTGVLQILKNRWDTHVRQVLDTTWVHGISLRAKYSSLIQLYNIELTSSSVFSDALQQNLFSGFYHTHCYRTMRFIDLKLWVIPNVVHEQNVSVIVFFYWFQHWISSSIHHYIGKLLNSLLFQLHGDTCREVIHLLQPSVVYSHKLLNVRCNVSTFMSNIWNSWPTRIKSNWRPSMYHLKH